MIRVLGTVYTNLLTPDGLMDKSCFCCLLTLYCACFISLQSLKGQDWQGYGNSPAQAEFPANSGGDTSDIHRFYLLKTGYLVEGKGVNNGTHYELQMEYGSMQIPVENVEFAAESLEGIYQYKKLQIDPRNCNQLMKLAEWCLAHQLVKEGIAEYRRAEQIAPNTIMGDHIRAQIAQAENPSAETSGRNPFVPPKQFSAPQESDDELDLWVNNIPQPVFDAFAKKVQPVLASRCASAECHGSNSENQFKIFIPRQPSGRSTYRNLKSAVQWIDLENPKASPLLTSLVSPHGGKKPLYNVESSQYQNFIDWIQLTGKKLPPELNASLQAQLREHRRGMTAGSKLSEPVLLPDRFQEAMLARQNTVSSPTQGMPNSFLPEQHGKMSDDSTVHYTPTRLVVPDEIAPASATPAPSYAAEAEKDPFDPDRFNARFHEKIWKDRRKSHPR